MVSFVKEIELYKTVIALLFLLAVATTSIGARAEELTPSKYRSLLEELQPAKDALWRTIPWKINLLDAQRQAVLESKPIFIWAMDGHPLGCT